MFGIDGSEFFVILLVLIVVVGPKDLPKMLKTMAKTIAYVRSTTNEFRHQFDNAMKQVEFDDLQKTLSEGKNINPCKELTEVLNPIHGVVGDMYDSLNTDKINHKLEKDTEALRYNKRQIIEDFKVSVDSHQSGRFSITSKRRKNTL
ncbi:Sec-independent protein translocase protein TatB [Bartonella sp. CB189]|uniref:Sec-independent protein translocase protein TatB n=1 Tax=Bartonella sp. CB189 TaxID=3112254 RepID=UPI002F9627A5